MIMPCHCIVIKQDICNKYIDIKFSVGCMVCPWLRLFHQQLSVKLLIRLFFLFWLLLTTVSPGISWVLKLHSMCINFIVPTKVSSYKFQNFEQLNCGKIRIYMYIPTMRFLNKLGPIMLAWPIWAKVFLGKSLEFWSLTKITDVKRDFLEKSIATYARDRDKCVATKFFHAQIGRFVHRIR